MRFIALVIFIFVGVSPFVQTAEAQSTTTGNDEISLYLGEMLPSQIDNVTDILPIFGGRYGFQTQKVGVAEIGLFNTHASGVDFTTLEASLRGDMPFSPGIDGIYYGGLDFNYYRPAGEDSRKNQTGFHVGTGAKMQVTDSLWVTGDLKFMGGPGTSLFLLFGVIFK